MKGEVPEVVRRVARWISDCGLVEISYTSDRKPAVGGFLRAAIREAGIGDASIQEEAGVIESVDGQHASDIDDSSVTIMLQSHGVAAPAEIP